MKKFLAVILSIFMIISVLPVGAFSAYAAEGDATGTENTLPANAIAINSVWELSMICNEYPADGYYYLTKDLDMSRDVAEGGDLYDDGKGWTPIGGTALPFSGTFDGQGHTIKNVMINRSTSYVGLFGYTSGAKVFDVTLENCTITGDQYTSAIAGGAANSEFFNLTVKEATIKGSSYVGGMIGGGFQVSIQDCTMDAGSVEATDQYVGGIAGQLASMAEKNVYDCVNKATVIGATKYVGGLFGELSSGNMVMDGCHNTGNVTATSDYVGGIAGYAGYATIQNCTNQGEVKSTTGYSVQWVGGIAGYGFQIENCVNRGNITASLKPSAYDRYLGSGEPSQKTSFAGGITGYASKISRCFSTGDVYVSGGSYTYLTSESTPTGGYQVIRTNYYYTYGGGITGRGGEIEQCYNTGTITNGGTGVVGAIVGGYASTTMLNCYSDANEIPLIGALNSGSGNMVTNCYNANGTIAAVGTATNSYYYAETESGIGSLRTKRQLRAKITFVDWDFDTIWTLEGNEDYRFPEFIDMPSEFVKSVTAISLVSTPAKTTYLEGKEVLDLSELKLKLTYDNETQEEIAVTADMVSGFDNSVVGSKTVQVTYQGFVAEFSVVIVAKSVVSVEMASLPAKSQYLEGKDLLDVTGAQLRVYYNNDTTQLVDVTPDMVAGFDNTITGRQSLTVTYDDHTATFDVEVLPKSITGILVHTLPQVLEYQEGDSLDVTGGWITIVYDNDTSEEIRMSECEISHTALSVYGQTEITVSYGGFETAFTVSVDHAYGDAYVYDADYHWNECVCGATNDKIPHQYDNSCDEQCNVCDYVRPITHMYTADCDTVCDVCSDERTAPTNHTYDNDCDVSCNNCGDDRTVGGHEYDHACDAYCNLCDAQRTVGDHVYDYACDADCNICGAVRTAEPHIAKFHTLINDATYPFTFSDDVYRSTNKAHSSSATVTIAFMADAPLIIRYYTSTEANYDKLYIKHNATNLVTASGTTSWNEITVWGAKGDKIYITYSKDGSYSEGGDRVEFSVSSGTTWIPTEDVDPSCMDAVVCEECGAIVKPALGGHSYDNACDVECNVCGLTRTVPTHVYDYDCDTTCNECGATRSAYHDYDNACDAYCNYCGDYRIPSDHVYTNACDASCNVCNDTRIPAAHVYSAVCDDDCDVCGEVREPADHTYSFECDTNCDVCDDYRVVTHAYDNDCDAYCNLCYAQRAVGDHVYDNACDAYCNICAAERTPEPHKVGLYTLVNATNYPFTLTNGVYRSTNKAHSSSATVTLTFETSGTLTIRYYTSTESGCDKLTIKHNSTTQITASGSTSWKEITIQGVVGDKVYIAYSKDGSVSSGSDMVEFSLSPSAGYRPAEDVEPSCAGAVVCDVCGTIVKPALEVHTYDNNCDVKCNVCGFERTVPAHVYDHACDRTCNECGATRMITHTYDDDCDTVCNLCAEERTVSHFYDNVCDAVCNACGWVRTAPHQYSGTLDFTCDVCGTVRVITGRTGDCTWMLVEDGTLTISGTGAMADYNYASDIPWGTGITSVVIEDGVTTIGQNALHSNNSLTSVTMPDSVVSIGKHAFYGCTALSSVQFSANLTTIGWYAFKYCALTSLTIPEGITRLEESVFDCNYSLTELHLNDNLTYISDWAFADCHLLSSVTIPSSVTVIATNAFFDCTALTSVYFTDLKAWFGIRSASGGANPLLNKKMYHNGELLTHLVIPEDMTTISDNTFYNCDSLLSVTIPASVTSIGANAFYDCDGLVSVTIGDVLSTDIVGDTTIGARAFRSCDALTEVTLGNCVTQVGYEAFEYSYALKTLNLGSRIQLIDTYGFNSCYNLTTVNYRGSEADRAAITINSSNTYLTTYATWYYNYCPHVYDTTCDTACNLCDAVRDITHTYDDVCDTDCNVCGVVRAPLHDYSWTLDCVCNLCGETRVVSGITGDCTWTLDAEGTLTISGNGSTADYDTYDAAPWSAAEVRLVVIEDGVTRVGTRAVTYTHYLTSVVIGDTVTDIDKYAFEGCSNLTDLVIGKQVTFIGYAAFRYASSLTRLVLGDRVHTLGNYAFEDAYRLTAVEMPKSVKIIGASAFSACSALTDVYYAGTETGRKLISYGEGNDWLKNAIWHYETCNHSYDSICDEDCNRCQAVREDAHVYTDPCDPICNVCDQVRVKIHVYDNPCDGTCNLCGFTRVPPHQYTDDYDYLCTPCGLTRAVSGTTGSCTWTVDEQGNLIISGNGAMADYSAKQSAPWGNEIITVTVQVGVTHIGVRAFSGCGVLVSVTLPDSVTKIDSYAFYDCVSLQTVEMGNGVTFIGYAAFYGNASLPELIFGDCVETIGSDVFDGCSALKAITLPMSLKVIGEGAFDTCTTLTDVGYAGSEDDRKKLSIGTQNDPLRQAKWYYAFCTHHYDDGCDEICNRCYVEREDAHVYVDACDADCNVCSAVRVNLHIYDNVCDSICNLCGSTRVALHNYHDAYDYKCDGCGLTRVVSGITGDCIWTVDEQGNLTISGNGAMADYGSATPAPWGNEIRTVTVEDGVTVIGVRAFSDCAHLISATIADSVTKIGNYAFCDCANLQVVEMGNGVTFIGYAAFQNNVSLFTILLGDSVETIGTYAFGDCTALKTMVLPLSIRVIGEWAFQGSDALTEVHYAGSEDQRKKISMGSQNDPLRNADWAYNACSHRYDHACDTICNVCGAIREVAHLYDHSCDDTCNICSAVRAVKHTYDHDYDPDCNACGTTREVPNYVYGDTDADGVMSVRDIALLQQYLCGWDVAVFNLACDLNGDGKLNNRDLVLLCRLYAGWEI